MNKTEAIEAIEEIKNIFCAANLFVKKEVVLPPVILDELCKVGEMATEIKKYVISENDKQVARLVDKLPRVVGLNIFARYDLKKDIRMSLAICNRCLYEVVQMLADNNVKNNLPPGLPAILGKAMDVGFVDVDQQGFKWMKSAALFGYFVDKVSDFLNLKPDNGRIPWKLFQGLFVNINDNNILAARKAINGYSKQYGNPPEEAEEVDAILK